jgi:hypothetical protein
MVDYSINNEFDIRLDDHNTPETVDGKDEFEEDVVIRLYNDFRAVIEGYSTSENITEKIQLVVRRLAAESGVIDSIERILVSRAVDRPETVIVEIMYSSGETFEETL